MSGTTATGNPAGAVNVERRTWNKAEYEGKDVDAPAESLRTRKYDGLAAHVLGVEKTQTVEEGRRALIQARTFDLKLDEGIGKRKTVTMDMEKGRSVGGGYFCPPCERSYHDSKSWLEHLNSRAHLRRVGYTPQVERSSVQSVLAKLAAPPKRKTVSATAEVDTEALSELRQQERDAERLSTKKARTGDADKPSGATGAGDDDELPDPTDATGSSGKGASGDAGSAGDIDDDDDGGAEEEEEDDEAAMAAMMGFSGFTTSKKA